ncbi:hypothetical protein CALCODRAFT_262493 [Calocera cornea HHB12733]|uniref:Uncharacterized protein n=1 Tax=Calocera cornea HHB12733 TaxID=1353952 RepID=A0A165GFB8_9BASI|nr:hypothetical protein CALCODRAFT_262493 [Calocera cornea HHB12733]
MSHCGTRVGAEVRLRSERRGISQMRTADETSAQRAVTMVLYGIAGWPGRYTLGARCPVRPAQVEWEPEGLGARAPIAQARHRVRRSHATSTNGHHAVPHSAEQRGFFFSSAHRHTSFLLTPSARESRSVRYKAHLGLRALQETPTLSSIPWLT